MIEPSESEHKRRTAAEKSDAAARALAEAAERRQDLASRHDRPTEHDGPAGPDPVRYGDWEIKGIAKDF